MKFGTKYILLMTLCALVVCFDHATATKRKRNPNYNSKDPNDNPSKVLATCDDDDEQLNILTNQLDLEDLEHILQKYPRIEELNPDLVKKPKNLKSLDLSFAVITTEELNTILKCCPNIEVLNLSGCRYITWKNIHWELLKNLKSLDLSFTDITTEDLNKILKCCPNLKKPGLVECNNCKGS